MNKGRLKIKVCGMRDSGNIAAVAGLHPDYMGFIFYPPSPRYCNYPDAIGSIPEDIIAVAVTVDMSERDIIALTHRYGFKAVQLHGSETPELCRRLRGRGLTVIKAVSVKGMESLGCIRDYEGSVDMFVFDTASSSKGGSGRKFDWTLISDMDIKTDFLLSGGIGPEDADAVLSFSHPHYAGVDLNSRFEIVPGIKDAGMLEKFVRSIFSDRH